MSLSLPYSGRVEALASAKLVSSQLESSRALNSEAMTGCVAMRREPSALEMKPPVLVKIHSLHHLSTFEKPYR